MSHQQSFESLNWLLRDLNISSRVQRLVSGQLPDVTIDDYSSMCGPIEEACFPPAFIPFNGRTGVAEGIWHHWFVNRPISYVLFFPNSGSVEEIARTDEQFLTLRFARYAGLSDVRQPSAKLRRVSDEMGIPAADRDTLVGEQGEAPFFRLSAFQSQLPRDRSDYYCPEDDWTLTTYDGFFPTKHWSLDDDRWRSCCRIEATYEDQSDFDSFQPINLVSQFGQQAPDWFAMNDPVTYFHKSVAATEYREAWLTLNSAFGNPEIASQQSNLLRKIELAANDVKFSRYLELWRSLTAYL